MNVALALNPPAASAAGGNPIIKFERNPMAGHTTMPPRNQTTPFGDVTLTSRWMRDHYVLCAYGAESAVRWMFPNHVGPLEVIGHKVRHIFKPAPKSITVERELRQACAVWQEHWDQYLADYHDRTAHAGTETDSTSPTVRTLSQLIETYLKARTGELAPRTMERNRHYLNRWIDALGGNLDIHVIDNAKLIAGRQKLTARLSAGTINVTFAVLRTCIRWAIDRGHLYQDPTKGLK